MLKFVVVQSEIWSNDGSVHTLEEAYKLVEQLQACISEMETRPTKRTVDVGYCVCKGKYPHVYTPGVEVCTNCKRPRN